MEREYPSTGRRLWPAVFASMALHGLVLGWVARANLSEPSAALAVTPPGIRVQLVRRPVTPPPMPDIDATSESDNVDDVASPSGTDTDIAASDTSEAGELVASIVPAVDAPGTTSSTEVPAAAEDENGGASAGVRFSAAGLRRNIGSYVSNLQPGFTQEHVEDCWLRRKENPLLDCDGVQETDKAGSRVAQEQVDALFRGITRGTRQARQVDVLQQRFEQLEQLRSEGGVAGEVAASLQALNEQYQIYLQGNPKSIGSSTGFQAEPQSAMLNQVIMNGSESFICAEKPCIYDYTGFKPVKPPEWVEAEEAANTFPYTPTLFGTRK